ncbi:prepilin peptidase [Demequina globuliformis]|uniref:prepilin peptidase n=1 Tax=Demequina globuliformis TaxID=676202 RepID=UPI000A033A76|nr:A24 family peptidase [Demequina globuliformis]
MTPWWGIAAVGLVGLLLGSFTNVLIARVPHHRNWVSDSSRCLQCNQDIAWYDNIPVLSWLVLRGKCRKCGARISWSYPAVELSVSALFVGVYLAFGLTVLGVVLSFFAVTTVALTVIDFQLMRLPSALIYPTLVVGLTGVVVAAFVAGEPWPLVRALLGALILGGSYFLLWFAYPQGLGFGDVRLAVPLGLVLGYLGWGALLIGAVAAPVLGMLGSITSMVRAGTVKGVKVPFGPWMIAGFWLAVFWGNHWWDAYLRWSAGWGS